MAAQGVRIGLPIMSFEEESRVTDRQLIDTTGAD